MEKNVQWIVENWDKIPDTFKQDIRKRYSDFKMNNLPDLESEEHTVVLLLDRQKPSVAQSWDFSEERIGVNKNGKIIWGFDSGCSCPSPWVDNYPTCYSVDKTYKQFTLNAKGFDEDWEKACTEKLEAIKNSINESTT